MKRIAVLFVLLLPLMMSACVVIHVPGDTPASSPAASSGVIASPSEPTATQDYVSATPEFTSASALPITPAVTNTPYSEPALYSSYAYMTAYHPASGVADFDYFDMLRGEDAVKWMVEKEGYSQIEAEAIAADFTDSEFIEKNENPQVRGIDLNAVELKLMFDADGDEMMPGGPVSSSVAILSELYAHHPSLVLDTYFYYIEVENGEAVSVTQVYWP